MVWSGTMKVLWQQMAKGTEENHKNPHAECEDFNLPSTKQ
jgi:hypothetical protein